MSAFDGSEQSRKAFDLRLEIAEKLAGEDERTAFESESGVCSNVIAERRTERVNCSRGMRRAHASVRRSSTDEAVAMSLCVGKQRLITTPPLRRKRQIDAPQAEHPALEVRIVVGFSSILSFVCFRPHTASVLPTSSLVGCQRRAGERAG